ncbi:MAG: hypothetical protein AB7F89_11960, partial [Pirellulaceae bacterium]
GDGIESVGGRTFPLDFDAINVGIEPFNIGPIQVGGGLGFGLLDIDTDGDGTDDSDVLFGRVLGQIAYGDIGLGIELVVTQHGPIGARLFAGVPVPVGTIVGALVGSVVPGLGTAIGAGAGTQSGFIITGFQGGLVFDGEPLPVVHEAAEILGAQFQQPLDVGNLDSIAEATERLFWTPDPQAPNGVRVYESPRRPWTEGFQVAISGVLTNLHVHGMIGLEVTLGANVGFGDLLAAQGELPPPEVQSVPGTDPGFQLYGIGTLEVMGQGLANAAVLFDFRDPLNPVLNMAAGAPVEGSLLSLLLPVDAEIGLRLETNGIVAGSVAAMQIFVDQISSGALAEFDGALTNVAAVLEADHRRVLAQLLLDANPADNVVDASEDAAVISLEFLKQRLGEIFSLDLAALENPEVFAPGNLTDGIHRATLTAGELIQAMVSEQGPEFSQQLTAVVLAAGQDAADTFYAIIHPSLTIQGMIQPALLGIPIGEPTERVEVRIDKQQLHFDGRFRILEKLMALSSLPLPLSDQIDVTAEIPFVNLLRDLALNQFPQIDATRDWRATFRGTVSLFNTFDLGDVTGLIFPAAPAPPHNPPLREGQSDADGDGIPDDHPLETHVTVIDQSGNPIEVPADGASVPYGPGDAMNAAGDRLLVSQQDFDTMREHGGILLDARLTLPHFITDPFDWFNGLRTLNTELWTDDEGNPLATATGNPCVEDGVPHYALLLDCFLADPPAFLSFAAEVANQIAAHDLVAQTQLYVPNIFDEIGAMVDTSIESLQSQVYAVFEELTDGDGNTLFEDLSELAARFQDGSLAELEAQFQSLLDTLVTNSYFRGEYGSAPAGSLATTGLLLGIDLGGATLQYADPDPDNADNGQRSFFVSADVQGLDARFEFAGLDDAFDPGSPPEFPRVGGEIAVGTKSNQSPPPAAAEMGDLLRGVAFPFPLADWLFPEMSDASSLQNTAGAVFRGYSPGFDASPEAPWIQRNGGIEVEAEVELNSPLGTFHGDVHFGLGPDAGATTGWRASGAFQGYGTLTLGGLVDIPLGDASRPLVSGELTEEGLLILDIGANLPGEMLGEQVRFAAGARLQLLVNLSDTSVTWDRPASDDEVEVAGYGVRLAVDGGLQLDDVLLMGTFLIDAASDGVTLAGVGNVHTGPFAPLFGLSQLDVSVVGGWRSVSGEGAYGAIWLAAETSFFPGSSDFFGTDAAFHLAFNTTAISQTVDLEPLAAGGIEWPSEVEALLAIPPSAFRVFAVGDIRLPGVTLDTAVMAQAHTQGLDLFVSGDLHVLHLGSSGAHGFVRITTSGQIATQLTLDTQVSSGFAGPGFELLGGMSFIANQTGTPILVPDPPGIGGPVSIPAGPFVRVASDGLGTVRVSNQELHGSFSAEIGGQVLISLANATTSLGLLTLSEIDGFLLVNQDGLATELSIGHHTSGNEFALDGTFLFQANTTGNDVLIDPPGPEQFDVPGEGGAYARVLLDGDLSLLGINLDGTFDLRAEIIAGLSLVRVRTTANVDVGPFSDLFSADADMFIFNTGLYADFLITPFGGSLAGTDLVAAGGSDFELDGTFRLLLSTASSDVARVEVIDATLTASGFSFTGSVDLTAEANGLTMSDLDASGSLLGNGLSIVNGSISVSPEQGFQALLPVTLSGSSPFGVEGFSIGSASLTLDIDSTRPAGTRAELVVEGELVIAGLTPIGVQGRIRGDTTGSLLADAAPISVGGASSSLVVSGTLQLVRAWEPGLFGRPVLVTSFGGENANLRWTPFNTFNSALHFNIDEFRVASDGRIDVAVDGMTFRLGGTTGTRMQLTTGPMTLDVHPAQGMFDLRIPSAQLEVPGLFSGTNKLSLPSWQLGVEPTFSIAQNLDFALGPFGITGGRLDFRRTASGVIELAVDPRSASVPFEFVLPGLMDIAINQIRVDTLGRFDLDVAAPQIGPSFLHIDNARLIVDKNTSSFSVKLNGGRLDLPIGPTIDMPQLTFST